MKFKVGDKVRIKNDLIVGKDYDNITFLGKMADLSGKELTIKEVEESNCKISEDKYNFYWSCEMLEKIEKNNNNKNFSVGDTVIITDTGELYSTYEDIIKVTEFYNRWKFNGEIDKNYLYDIVYIHKDNNICFVQKRNDEKDIYIMGKNGLRKAVINLGQKGRVNLGEWKGNVVTVVDEKPDEKLKYINNTVGVKFSRKSEKRHDCKGKCLSGYGWYYPIKDLEFVEDTSVSKVNQNKSNSQKDEPNLSTKSNNIEIEKLFSKFEEISNKTADTIKEQIKSKENQEIERLTKEVSKLTKEISTKERMQDLLNEAIIEKGKEIAIEDLKEKLKSELDNFIEEKYGILPKRIEIVTDKSNKQMQGIFHKDFEKICKLVNANIPVMLTGGAGAGKNYTLEQVAEALDLDFYFSNAVNQEYKLTGFIDANGTYHETEFYKAFTKGGMFFLDEIDASSPECLVILNSAIANKYFDFPTGRVKANENFRVVCAGNTYGTGADMVYVGRNVLDGATLDRFVVIPFDYDENVEKQLAYDIDLYEFIYNLRKAVNESNLRYIVSMRALINATKMLELGISKQEILKTAIIKNMQIDDINTIYNKLPNSNWKDELDKYIRRG